MGTIKIKVSELTGVALDWAVAKCEDKEVDYNFWLNAIYMPGWFVRIESNYWRPLEHCSPSTNWSQGGPIIEREEITIKHVLPTMKDSRWQAFPSQSAKGAGGKWGVGPTPLIAAMRCFVVSKLGDEVEIPEELL